MVSFPNSAGGYILRKQNILSTRGHRTKQSQSNIDYI